MQKPKLWPYLGTKNGVKYFSSSDGYLIRYDGPGKGFSFLSERASTFNKSKKRTKRLTTKRRTMKRRTRRTTKRRTTKSRARYR